MTCVGYPVLKYPEAVPLFLLLLVDRTPGGRIEGGPSPAGMLGLGAGVDSPCVVGAKHEAISVACRLGPYQ